MTDEYELVTSGRSTHSRLLLPPKTSETHKYQTDDSALIT